MKKTVVVVITFALIAGCVALAVGCGGSDNTAQAKADAQAADKLRATVEQNFQKYMSELQSAESDPEKGAAIMMNVDKDVAKLQKEVDNAIAAYKKVVAAGVADYKKYAELQIEVGQAIKEILTTTKDFLNQMMTLATSGGSEDEMTQLSEEYAKQMEDLSAQAEKAEKEAEALKKSKNL